MNLSEKIIELRNSRAWSQTELARRSGVSQSTIAKIEIGRNEATGSTLARLAMCFEVSVDYLLGIEEDVGSLSVRDELTTDEREIVSIYRSMSDEQKRIAKNIVATLGGRSTESSEKGKRA